MKRKLVGCLLVGLPIVIFLGAFELISGLRMTLLSIIFWVAVMIVCVAIIHGIVLLVDRHK